MKKLIALGLILASTSGFAYDWSMTNIESYYANTDKEVANLLTQFPEILKNTTFEAKDIDFVSVNEYSFRFVGETTCADGDERLESEMLTYFACPIDKPTECITRFRDLLPNVDPCLETE